MALIFLILGFIASIVLIYFFYSLVSTQSLSGQSQSRPTLSNLSFTLIRQRFTGLGWVGVVLVFLAPLATAIIVSANLKAIAEATFFDTPIRDFTLLYLSLGFLGLIGFVFIIIGREFYSLVPANGSLETEANRPAPHPAPHHPATHKHTPDHSPNKPAHPQPPLPQNPTPLPEAEPVPRPEFVTTMKDDVPPSTKL
ncbi:hypothetical protein H3S84_03775 [Bartonella sp. W8098]|uniref:hypothetical protein n=1 Tax=Bartonella TaxID=773 RepID=UPI0018DDABA3|nr:MULTISPECIES: hypothetical protein [Bartonella]MBH9987387.1 hypothetical protein [Bartonella apis]MBI0171604.1 hypothetical protein [Bartonella sp. W8151]